MRFIDIPPRSFECSLAQLQPSVINAPNGLWPEEARKLFRNLTEGVEVMAEVCILHRKIMYMHMLKKKQNNLLSDIFSC